MMRNICLTCLCVLSAVFAGITQETQLTAFDGSFADQFGYSVAIAGEYAVVGAPLQGDFGTNNAGAAYIFQNIAGTWTYVKKLVPPWGGSPGDQFGLSVDMDSNQVMVGAPYTDHYDQDDVGSAYIFRGSGSIWTLEKHLFPFDGAAHDHFANDVGIDGDHAVVGAAADDDRGSSSGSAYIYGYHNHNWNFEEKIYASDAANGDGFGTSVAIDSINVVIGAPGNIGAENKHSGAVYVFHPYAYGWHQAARLTHTSPDYFDHLGESVAIEGGLIIAGAPFANDKTGEAYIFGGMGYDWSQLAQLVAADGMPHDKFGISVDMTTSMVVVGAHLDDDLGMESGAMYVFGQSGMVWNQADKHTASDGAAYDRFGHSVGIDGNYAIAGAQNQDVINTDAGAAYIYSPALAPACAPNMYLSGVISSGTYLASDHIQIDGSIAPSTVVTLGSPNFIELMQSFEVAQGASLEISMQGCN